ncbi:hypothetical protein DFH09DRAFT_1280539, partial [Mycena vulgaris]
MRSIRTRSTSAAKTQAARGCDSDSRADSRSWRLCRPSSFKLQGLRPEPRAQRPRRPHKHKALQGHAGDPDQHRLRDSRAALPPAQRATRDFLQRNSILQLDWLRVVEQPMIGWQDFIKRCLFFDQDSRTSEIQAKVLRVEFQFYYKLYLCVRVRFSSGLTAASMHLQLRKHQRAIPTTRRRFPRGGRSGARRVSASTGPYSGLTHNPTSALAGSRGTRRWGCCVRDRFARFAARHGQHMRACPRYTRAPVCPHLALAEYEDMASLRARSPHRQRRAPLRTCTPERRMRVVHRASARSRCTQRPARRPDSTAAVVSCVYWWAHTQMSSSMSTLTLHPAPRLQHLADMTRCVLLNDERVLGGFLRLPIIVDSATGQGVDFILRAEEANELVRLADIPPEFRDILVGNSGVKPSIPDYIRISFPSLKITPERYIATSHDPATGNYDFTAITVHYSINSAFTSASDPDDLLDFLGFAIIIHGLGHAFRALGASEMIPGYAHPPMHHGHFFSERRVFSALAFPEAGFAAEIGIFGGVIGAVFDDEVNGALPPFLDLDYRKIKFLCLSRQEGPEFITYRINPSSIRERLHACSVLPSLALRSYDLL